MAMASPIEPLLHPVPIKHLRPTQMTIGMGEVDIKRREWRARAAQGAEYLGRHMIPAVLGPGNAYWMIDHHHLVRALHEEGVSEVLVSVVARLDHLTKPGFLTFLDNRNWLHLYDAKGERQSPKALPRHIESLADDPYRSLAGEVRRLGGFAKDATPYSEFLWADFFRSRVRARQIERHFERSVKKALELARSREAGYLPGYAGPEYRDGIAELN